MGSTWVEVNNVLSWVSSSAFERFSLSSCASKCARMFPWLCLLASAVGCIYLWVREGATTVIVCFFTCSFTSVPSHGVSFNGNVASPATSKPASISLLNGPEKTYHGRIALHWHWDIFHSRFSMRWCWLVWLAVFWPWQHRMSISLKTLVSYRNESLHFGALECSIIVLVAMFFGNYFVTPHEMICHYGKMLLCFKLLQLLSRELWQNIVFLGPCYCFPLICD